MLLSKDRKALLSTVGVDTWEEQDEILDHPARIKLVAGGERAGKSFMGAISIISRLELDDGRTDLHLPNTLRPRNLMRDTG